MAYRLYFDEFSTVRDYDKYSRLSNEQKEYQRYLVEKVTPLKLKLDGKVRDTFKIEDIDTFTSSQSSEEAAIMNLKGHRIDYLSQKEQLTNKLILVLHHNGIKEIPIIYRDILLWKASMNLRKKKKYAKKGEKVVLDNFDELNDFVEHIKFLTKNNFSRDYLLDPKSIKGLNKNEIGKLNIKSFDDTRKYNGNGSGIYDSETVRIGLRTLLKEYLELDYIYQDKISKGISTVSIEEDIRKNNNDLINYFKSNYMNLRDALVWEQNFLKILKNKANSNIPFSEKEEIIKEINYLEHEKKCRNREIERSEKYELDEGYYDKQIKMDFDDENLEYHYEHSDLDELMESTNLDDMTDDDKRRLGIIR